MRPYHGDRARTNVVDIYRLVLNLVQGSYLEECFDEPTSPFLPPTTSEYESEKGEESPSVSSVTFGIGIFLGTFVVGNLSRPTPLDFSRRTLVNF